MKRVDQQARDFWLRLNSATCALYETFDGDEVSDASFREEENSYFQLASNLWLAICVAYNHIYFPRIGA